jgi:hypothetical protein
MNLILKQPKQYKCFECGKPIKFIRGSRQRFNLDGTPHICERTNQDAGKKAREAYGNNRSSRGKRYWSWYFGYGPGRYHKENWKRYSGDQYRQSRERAREAYNQYRSRYTNTDLTRQSACEILNVDVNVLTMRFEQAYIIIRKAYAVLALKFHPDRNHDKGAREKFEQATQAFELLAEKRAYAGPT